MQKFAMNDLAKMRGLETIDELRQQTTQTACPPTSAWNGSVEPVAVCSACDGMGYYKLAVPFGDPNFGQLQRCECGQAADKQRAAEQLHAQLGAERGRYADATIAGFQWDRPLPGDAVWHQNPMRDPETGEVLCDRRTGEPLPSRYTPAQQRQSLARARPILEQYAAHPIGGLFLYGPYGTGKTHLAAAIANACTARKQSAEYLPIGMLLKHLRAGFNDHSADKRLDDLIALDFLAIDDLGTDHLSGWGDSRLYDVVNARYNAARCTVLTSNLPITGINGRIASRILQECTLVPLIAYDYRQIIAEQRLRGAA